MTQFEKGQLCSLTVTVNDGTCYDDYIIVRLPDGASATVKNEHLTLVKDRPVERGDCVKAYLTISTQDAIVLGSHNGYLWIILKGAIEPFNVKEELTTRIRDKSACDKIYTEILGRYHL